MSAIVLFSPVMCSGSNGDAFRDLCLSDSKRKRQAAAIEVDVPPLYDHDTAEVLS